MITETLGSDDWIKDTHLLEGLKPYADDKSFQAKWRAIKLANKERLAVKIKVRCQLIHLKDWSFAIAWRSQSMS